MNLQTNYLGLTLKNPLVAGASPLSYDVNKLEALEDAGIAAVTMYSLFEEQITQNLVGADSCEDDYSNSFMEAATSFGEIGILDRGVDSYLEQLQTVKDTLSIPVFGSLNGTRDGEWTKYASLIEGVGADALELNLYCLATNLDESAADMEERYLRIVLKVRERISIPLVVKLSPTFTALPNFAKRLQESGVDAIVLFNRMYQPDFDIDRRKVNASLKLSYGQELRLRLRWLSMLSGRIDCQFSASGGVYTGVDALKALMAGADTIQLVSTILMNGAERVSDILSELEVWMAEHGYKSLDEVRGCMNYGNSSDPEALERANYMRILKSWR